MDIQIISQKIISPSKLVPASLLLALNWLSLFTSLLFFSSIHCWSWVITIKVFPPFISRKASNWAFSWRPKKPRDSSLRLDLRVLRVLKETIEADSWCPGKGSGGKKTRPRSNQRVLVTSVSCCQVETRITAVSSHELKHKKGFMLSCCS